jgi:beta-glucosidase-like glycosyl hydrolase
VQSEDPQLTSAFVKAYSAGIRGDRWPQTYSAFLSCLHFAAYDFENQTLANGTVQLLRWNADFNVSHRDLVETYFPVFRTCAQEHAGGVMCAYDSIDGALAECA